MNRRIMFAHIAVGLTLAALSLGVSGCRAMAMPWLMWGEEPTKKIPAEYTELAGKKVCIVVWAEMDTMFEFPLVRYELAEHVRYALEGSIPKLSCTPTRPVVEFQTRDPDWDRRPPASIGAKFGADRVLLIELSQYSTREPDSPHLYRGRISAHVSVYDTAKNSTSPLYKTEIETVYPKDSVGQWGSDDSAIRMATMQAFAQDLTGKFCERTVKVKK